MLRHPVPGRNFFPIRVEIYISASLRIAIRFVSSCGDDSLKILNRSRGKNRPFYPVHERRSRISLVSPDKETYFPSLFLFLFKEINIYILDVQLFPFHSLRDYYIEILQVSTHEYRADTQDTSRDITRMQIWLRYMVLQLQAATSCNILRLIAHIYPQKLSACVYSYNAIYTDRLSRIRNCATVGFVLFAPFVHHRS